MSDKVTDFTIGDGGLIIPLGKGNSDRDSIDTVKRKIFNTDRGLGQRFLSYFDSLSLQGIVTNTNLSMIQGERKLEDRLAIQNAYNKIIYQVVPSSPILSTPTPLDYSLLFWIRFPLEGYDGLTRLGFHGLIRDDGSVSSQIETGNFRKERILDIQQEFVLEMMRAYNYLLSKPS